MGKKKKKEKKEKVWGRVIPTGPPGPPPAFTAAPRGKRPGARPPLGFWEGWGILKNPPRGKTPPP